MKHLASVLAILIRRPGLRASDIGWELWGKTTEAPDRGTGSHGQNKFCRAAGRVLKGMEREGLVRWVGEYGTGSKGCVAWCLTIKGAALAGGAE